MDGVRIYLPYDNRLDFNRFLTPDLSEIQVEKGYVSVLNGPGVKAAPSTSSAGSRPRRSSWRVAPE